VPVPDPEPPEPEPEPDPPELEPEDPELAVLLTAVSVAGSLPVPG
jgi:hypothetical protein